VDPLFLWLIGSFFGVSYVASVGLVLGVCLLSSKRFRPGGWQCLSLLAPACLYYALEHLVAKRQEWNVPIAVLVITLFASGVVVAARVTLRPRVLPIGAIAGMAVAIVAWALVPHGSFTMP
jgi:uncharacterized membrane protein